MPLNAPECPPWSPLAGGHRGVGGGGCGGCGAVPAVCGRPRDRGAGHDRVQVTGGGGAPTQGYQQGAPPSRPPHPHLDY
eukprot:4499753-Pyramimonas_sp.AAC.2